MQKDKRKEKTKNDTTLTFVAEFKPSLWSRFLTILGIIIMLILFVSITYAMYMNDALEEPSVWLQWFCIIAPVLIIGGTALFLRTIIAYFQTTLTVYKEGIVLIRGATRLSTKWENIRYFNPQHGLLLYKPAAIQRYGIAERLFFEVNTKVIYPDMWSPMPSILSFGEKYAMDEETFWESEFGQLLREYAPHVKTIKNPTDKMIHILKPKEDDASTKKNKV